MQIVIKIDKDDYEMCKTIMMQVGYKPLKLSDNLKYAIANGTVLPEHCEILTKEAYADLCYKAAGLEREVSHE